MIVVTMLHVIPNINIVSQKLNILLKLWKIYVYMIYSLKNGGNFNHFWIMNSNSLILQMIILLKIYKI